MSSSTLFTTPQGTIVLVSASPPCASRRGVIHDNLTFCASNRLELTFCRRYSDDKYEYRHVQLPKAMLKAIPKEYHDQGKGTLKLLWEEEWRAIGITQVRRC